MSLTMAFAATASAAPRSWKQAKAIAQQEAAKIGIPLDKGGLSIAKAKGQATPTDASYYVFAKDKGYVIVSGDDEMPDIVGYSATGTYDADNLPDNFAATLKAYDSLVKAVQRGDASALRTVEEAKALRAEKKSKAVEPLLGGIMFDQEAPYNNFCPVYNGDTLCVTGCTATAMAQIMAYYKYPAELLADIPAYTTKKLGYNMPAIQKGVAYDWDNILPTYKEGNYTKAQGDAVATLMLHCGCAVEMDYAEESGATVTAEEMVKYFGYDKELVQWVGRNAFTMKQWTDIIDRELQEKRPILYAGFTHAFGHQFVCDGADGNGLYHINWGWGGYRDSYFDLAILNSDKADNPSEDADGYSRYCRMIIGLTPDNGKVDEPLVTFDPIIASGTFHDYILWTKNKRSNASEAFTATINASFYNELEEDFTGYFAIGTMYANGEYQILRQSDKLTLGADKYFTFPFDITQAFEPGNVEIYYLYSTDNKTWKPCKWYDGVPFLLTVTDTEITEGSPIDMKLSFDRNLEYGKAAYATLEFTNNTNEEWNGLITLSMKNDQMENDTIVGSVYAILPVEKAVTKVTAITPKAGGHVKVYAKDGGKNVLAEWEYDVAGTTAVSSAAATKPSFSVVGGEGCITVKAAEAKDIAVYNANGTKVAGLSLKGGEQKSVALQPGVYIVNNAKVVVR